ncbi:MAG: hypothetical protein IKP36_11505 [Bacteroidaceae bacterium]|nr:hypothetical protein [Bacteroidaceae bacterium]
MKEFAIRYKWVIIIGLILVVLFPIALNYILLIPINAPVLGESNGWLAFWGCYSGAIISSAIAFMILFIQRKDNHQENSNNRQFELNIITYQQQCQWLNAFRNASIANINAYKADYLKEIIDLIRSKDLGKIQQKIKEVFENLTKTDTEVAIVMPPRRLQNNNLISYNNKRIEIYDIYSAIVYDLQVIAIYYCLDVSKKDFDKNPSVASTASINLKNILAGLKPEDKLDYNQVFAIANQLISSVPTLFHNYREAAVNCIGEEQIRIEKELSHNI